MHAAIHEEMSHLRICHHGSPLFEADGQRIRLASDVRRVVADSRVVERGDLFVALPGGHHNGLEYVGEAMDRGAVGVVAPWQAALEIPRWAATSSPRLLFGHLAAASHGYPGDRIAVIAVTGTNGKTTVVELGRQLFEAAGIPAASIGTLSPEEETKGLTTPFPDNFQDMLSRLAAQGKRVVWVEASSHALVQHRLAGTALHLATVTTLARDHLDYHPTLASYWAAKRRLVKHPLSPWFLRPTEGVILPVDDASRYRRFRQHAGAPVTLYGRGAAVALKAEAMQPGQITVALSILGEARTFELPWMGDAGLASLEAVVATAAAWGLAPETIFDALKGLHLPDGRQQWFQVESGPWVVVDYAHNPEALTELLSGIRRLLPAARITTVFGGRGHRDRGKLVEMGVVAGQLADRVVATVDNPYEEDPEELAHLVLHGALASGRPASYVPDRFTAILQAVLESRPGDVVTVTGRGHESWQWGQSGRRSIGRDGDWVTRVLGASPVPPRA